MNIHEGAEKILRYFLDKVIACGNLDETFVSQYDTLASEIGLESGDYCRVCCQYLRDIDCIKLNRYTDNRDPTRKGVKVRITASAIDFIEN